MGVRPINGIVDLTNYLTLDWSQPVHAYDAEKIEGNKIVARMAKKGETLTLLDDAELELSKEDMVIADGKKALCLAGVMGGMNSVISPKTKTMFFESANFEAASVRRSALRHKVRTESSMRFEKTLDPNQNIEGIMRFLKLAKDFDIPYKSASQILSVGVAAEEETLHMSHEFFEKRLGIVLTDDDIIAPLRRIGFTVSKSENAYDITIPTYRGSKDVSIKEDILEEVIRFYGFKKIDLQLPKIEKNPGDLSQVLKLRNIKKFFANAAAMMEQQNYALYDEAYAAGAGIDTSNAAAEIINSMSDNTKRLVASLIPGLCKNIKDNFVAHDTLRFFEVGATWQGDKKDELVENKKVSGIFFEKRIPVDFYTCKQYIQELFILMGLEETHIVWEQIKKPQDP